MIRDGEYDSVFRELLLMFSIVTLANINRLVGLIKEAD